MNIDKTSMQSNYLFNKGFIVLEDCEKWRNGLPIISKPWKWRFIYEAVERSCVNSQCTTFPKFDSLLNSNSINRFGDSDIQLACLNFEGEYFSQAAIESYVTNNSAVLFESFKLFSGSVLYGKSFSGNVNFKWDSKHYFSNKNGNELLSVNLSDGSGWISLPIDGSISINSNYDCIGEKSIAFRSIEGQDTIYSYSSINIKIVNPLSPTEVNTISIIIEDSTDYSQSRMSTPGNGTIEVHGEYFYFQGIDGKLDKPIIISEGIDIAGDQDWTDLVDENHLTHLLQNGYDVFYLTYTRSNRSLLDNAVIVKELIKKINNEKVLHFEGIYIGESMGGILGRIALKQLENEGYNHQFGLFIALDAPMKGANVPLGLQWIANDLISSLGLFAVFTTIGAELFELFTNTDQPYVDILGQLTSPAARQMIIKHYLGNADYQFMQNYLDQLSYPEKCRNVCATSGGENIIENVISSAFSEEYIISPLAVVVPIGPYSATISARYSGVSVENYWVSKLTYFNIYHPLSFNYVRRREDFNFQKFDSEPGGYETYTIGSNNIKFCFVPTSSSIGLNTQEFNSPGGLFLFNRDNEQQLISQDIIPFDDVYVNRINKKHRGGFNREFELDSMEIMYDRMYLQNRIVTDEKNFETSNLIELGYELRTEFNDYDAPSTNSPANFEDFARDPFKNILPGEFIVLPAAKVEFNSGKEIIIKTGTDIQVGSEVSLFISSDPNVLKINHYPTSEIVNVTYLDCKLNLEFSSGIDISAYEFRVKAFNGEELIVKNQEKVNLPYGQYTLLYENIESNLKYSTSNVFSIMKECIDSKSISESKRNISLTVFPNPGYNYFYFLLDENPLTNCQINLFSQTGELLLSYKDERTFIDLTNFPSGVYIVQLTHNEGVDYSKIIKL